MEEVIGSIPIRSTKYLNNLAEPPQNACPHFVRISSIPVRSVLAIGLLSFFLRRSIPGSFPQNLRCVHCTVAVAGVAVEGSTSEPPASFFIVS